MKPSRRKVPLDEEYLTPKELAARLKMHKVTLAQWRKNKKGPRFRRFGKAIRYPLHAVIAWELARPTK